MGQMGHVHADEAVPAMQQPRTSGVYYGQGGVTAL